MTFSPQQQEDHRNAFIAECRERAWGAACHADWIASQLEKMTADYSKLTQEDEKLAAEIKALETAIDSHTKDNRDKRKTMQERRNMLSKQMSALGRMVHEANQAANTLYGNVETQLALAKHAETWEWKEAQSTPSDASETKSAEQRAPAQ